MAHIKVIAENTNNTSYSLKLTLTQFKLLILAMRPKQWIKNLILFTALLFSLNRHWSINDIGQAINPVFITVIATSIFCLLSGAEYLINDLLDIEADRQHPGKKDRPLAAGKLNVAFTRLATIALVVILLPASYWFSLAVSSSIAFGLIVTIYFLLALSYSLLLKRLVIIDVLAIAGGFVLRAVAGAVILNFEISAWLYICTLLLALFLALSKRRQELNLLTTNSGNHRYTLNEYVPSLLNEMITLVVAATLISYSFYTFNAQGTSENHSMMITIPFVLYGIFRYLYLVHVKGMGGSPEEMLLKDKPLLITAFSWGAVVFIVLSFAPPGLT
jgi:4-hydroxybenzoate polyprenyltransferase